LSPSSNPLFVLSVFEIGSHRLFALGLALNCDPPDPCLLSGCDYRHEPPAASYKQILLAKVCPWLMALNIFLLIIDWPLNKTDAEWLLGNQA
jgi:hypothetical protein